MASPPLALARDGTGHPGAGVLLPRPPSHAGTRVLVVSIEGLRRGSPSGLEAPTLSRMSRGGARVGRVRPAPGSSFLGAMATAFAGVGSRRHRITWEGFRPGGGFARSMTIFDQLRTHGMTAHVVASDRTLQHLCRPGTVARFVIAGPDPTDAALRTLREMYERRPDLVVLHLDQPARALPSGRRAFLDAVTGVDQAMALLDEALTVRRIAGDVTMLVLLDPDQGPPGEVPIPPLIAVGHRAKKDLLVESMELEDVASTLVWLLDLPLPDFWVGRPLVRAFEGPRFLAGRLEQPSGG